MQRIIAVLTVCFLATLISGCNQDQSSVPEITGSILEPKQEASFETVLLGKSVEGREIGCTVISKGFDTTLVIASIHGSERAGTPILESLKEHIQSNPDVLTQGKRVVIVPKINPDGFAKKTRHNANGIDLNRNFPADNRVNNKTNGYNPLCEPESRIIRDMIQRYQPSKILVFHEALNCIDYDGPGGYLARQLAERCPLPFKKLGACAGSLGAYAGETLMTPTITVELTKQAKSMSKEQLWNRYKEMLIYAINN